MGRTCVDKVGTAGEMTPPPSGCVVTLLSSVVLADIFAESSWKYFFFLHLFQTRDTCESSAGQREYGALTSNLWAAVAA